MTGHTPCPLSITLPSSLLIFTRVPFTDSLNIPKPSWPVRAMLWAAVEKRTSQLCPCTHTQHLSSLSTPWGMSAGARGNLARFLRVRLILLGSRDRFFFRRSRRFGDRRGGRDVTARPFVMFPVSFFFIYLLFLVSGSLCNKSK